MESRIRSREQRSSERANREAEDRTRASITGHRQALASAEIIAERYEQLLRDGAASELQALQAQAKVDKLRSKLEEDEQQLERLTAITATGAAKTEKVLRETIERNLRQALGEDPLPPGVQAEAVPAGYVLM